MVNSKNSLNLSSKNKTNDAFNKSIYSRPQVDSLIKKENVFKKPLSPSIIVSEIVKTKPEIKIETKESQSSIDDNKRLFFKVAGVAGLGLAASALFPKSSEAYVSGSTPTSNVVGLKDHLNTRIDPAQETGGNLATIAGKDFATQTTLAGIKTQSDKFTFDGENLKVTSSGSGGSSDVVGLKDTSDVRINPAQDDSIILLRRVVKLMESQAVVDNQMRQRVTLDAIGVGTPTALATTIPISGSLTTAGTVSTVTTVTTVATVTSLNQLAGVDARWQIIDWARQVYNSGMRRNLSW